MTDKAMPQVSVIMPSYNSAAFIAESIASVQRQTHQDWELIIYDDGSTDESVGVIHGVMHDDDRIALVEGQGNQGAAVARNEAIKRARGRFIAFLDSDDVWLPEKLDRQIAFMTQNGYAMTYTYYTRMTEDGVALDGVVMPDAHLDYTDLLKSNQIGCLTAIYDTQPLGKVYMPLIRKRQDYGLWLAILKKGVRAYCLTECLAVYRVRSGSISSNKLEMLRYNWSLYREVERFSVLRSAYYLGWNIMRKLCGK